MMCFGKLISKTGDSGCRFGFQSKYFDEESGLNYFYHRYYDPEVGRFINEDPVGLGSYTFVGNHPVLFIDPTGLRKCRSQGSNVNEYYIGIKSYEPVDPGIRVKIFPPKIQIYNWKVIANVNARITCVMKCTEKCEEPEIRKIQTTGVNIFKDREFIIPGPGNPVGWPSALKRVIELLLPGNYMRDYLEGKIKEHLPFWYPEIDKICNQLFGS